VRDLGCIDYRLTPDGRIYFLELNALPMLNPGAVTYASGQSAGLKDMDSVMDAVIRSAAERQGIDTSKSRLKAKRRQLRVGLAYNLKRIVPKSATDDDSEAEYDSWSTIEAIGKGIASHGHEVVYLEATPELPAIIAASQIDFVFNVAEGIQGRNREASVPAILELLDIPYTGSDPATLSITLDKALSKKILMQAGIRTPKFCVMRTGKERLPKDLHFPVIIKPVAEGSSKGVEKGSVLESEDRLREAAAALFQKYKQPVLVEEFLSGREFTLGLLGENRPKVLPPMEIVYTNPDTKFPIYTFEHKLTEHPEVRYEAPAKVDAKLLRELERVARNSFIALGCRDVSRIDLRCGANGKVYFIECNPLPGLTPDWSDMCLVAKAAGMSYRDLIGEIMAPAIARVRDKQKQNGATPKPGGPA
jgi:D-alanine-D-alanine ligase